MTVRTLRLSREQLADAVAPEPLIPTLQNLVTAGAIAGFREHGLEVVIWGELGAAEAALEVIAQQQEAPDPAEPVMHAKSAYYQRCQEYMRTRSFVALPPLNKEIWRLHAIGVSHRDIAVRLGTTPMKVRLAVRGARLAARLPRNVVTTRPGPGPGVGRPPLPEKPKCSTPGCGADARRWGLCERCSMRRYRQA